MLCGECLLTATCAKSPFPIAAYHSPDPPCDHDAHHERGQDVREHVSLHIDHRFRRAKRSAIVKPFVSTFVSPLDDLSTMTAFDDLSTMTTTGSARGKVIAVGVRSISR